MAACDLEDTTDNVMPAGTITFGAYAADGSSFTVSLNRVRPTVSCVTSITYQWMVPAYYYQDAPRTNVGFSYPEQARCAPSVTTTVTVPTRVGGGTLHFRLKKDTGRFLGKYISWASVAIPAYTVSPVAFVHASPAGDEGTLVDARLSTAESAMTYAWAPSQCAGTSYQSGGQTVAAPSGTAVVGYGVTGTCTVAVTNAAGASASAAVPVTSLVGLHNGYFTFGSTTTATISGSYYGIAGAATTACVDLPGSGVYSTPVALTGTSPSTGTVTLTNLSPGLHKVGATLWSGGDNAACTVTSTYRAVQTIADLYSVDAAGVVGAARRAGRTASYAAPSSLRFSAKTTISGGTLDNDTLSLKGATLSGSFLWSTPRRAGRRPRPAGAAKLAKGTFVMRSIDMVQGPLVGKASTLLGAGTVLLRGTDGTMACATLWGGFDSSTLTLSGGTRAARTLAGNVTGKRVTYVFPKVPALTSRSGGVSGFLETALGWITGDQPTERAKKPSKKPKPVKVKPVKARGTANLQTAAKPKALPAACKALVKYLPQ